MISLISPCYNGEKFLHGYFQTLLNQTYKDIEVIFVDDGSTDKTFTIATNYKPKLEAQGMVVKLFKMPTNTGAAGAVNYGLKHFTRKYLMFLDSDDIMYPNHIQRKVEYMEKTGHEFVSCKVRKIDNETGKNLGVLGIQHDHDGIDIFERLITRGKVVFCPIVYVFRSDAFLKVNPEREIYVTKAGQNWQILLPMAHKYKMYFIEEILGNYIVRKDSMSRTVNKESNLNKTGAKEEILRATLNRLDLENKAYIFSLFEK